MSKETNASNSQPPRWRLPPRHEQLLRTALASGEAGRVVSSEQRAIIHQICSSPEKGTSAPEDFVIAFKLALTDAANDVGIPPGPERTDFLARMVSACIEEFFRSPAVSNAPDRTSGQEMAPDSL